MITRKSFFVFHTFLGLFFVLFGILGVLAQFGMEYFVPLSVFSQTFLEILLLLVGIFFIREAVNNKDSQQRFVHFVVGLSLFFFAVLPLFVELGILRFLPYFITLEPSPFLLSLLLCFSGIYMILDRFFLLSS